MEMNVKTYAIGIISLIIAALLVVTVLVPITSTQSSLQETYANYGYQVRDVGNDTVTIVYDGSAKTLTVGSETTSWAADNAALVAVVSDSGYISTGFAGNSTVSLTGSGSTITAHHGATACKITVNGSAKTISVTDITSSSSLSEYSWTYSDWCFVPDMDGDKVAYVPYSTNKTAYIESDADTYALFTSASYLIGFENETATTTVGTVTYETNFEGTEVSGVNDLSRYQIGTAAGSQYNLTVGSDTVNPTVIVMDQFASGVVTGQESTHTLVGLIPLLVFAGLVIAAVRLFLGRSD